MDIEADIEVDVGADVEIEVEVSPDVDVEVVPEVEVDLEAPLVEAEVEIEIDVPQVEVDLGAEVQVEIEPEVEVEVEVEVEIEVPEVDIELEAGFGTTDPLNVEVELGAPNVEIEVGLGADIEVEDIDVDAEVEVELVAPVVQIDFGAPKKQPKAKAKAKAKKPAPVRPQAHEPLIQDDGVALTVRFLGKIWTWLLLQAMIPFFACLVIVCLPHEWFAPITTGAWYQYAWQGAVAFEVVLILITLSSCASSTIVGLILWVLLLVGSLAIFCGNCMRQAGTEASSSVIFLGTVFFMLCGLSAYSRTPNPSHDPCDAFGYIVGPQIFWSLIVCLFDSYNSGKCVWYCAIVSVWGLLCNISGEMILNGHKYYRRSQSCPASQKMYTDVFSI
jgi:hypothetical protein